MKVVILGATGPTGQHLVTEALGQGHEVTALVRAPEKMTTQNDKLKVVKCNIYEASEMSEHMKGCDGVLSAVGGRGGVFTPCDVYSKSGEAIVKAMRENGVKKFVAVSAWGTKDDKNLPFLWRWVLKPSLFRNLIKDMGIFEEFLEKECSDINYTVVRPPRLTNEPSTGAKVIVQEGQAIPGVTPVVSRQDMAIFMLDCLKTQEYDKKMVAVASSSPAPDPANAAADDADAADKK